MAIDYDGGLTCAMGVTEPGPEHRLVSRRARLRPALPVDDIAWCELQTGVARVNVGLVRGRGAGRQGRRDADLRRHRHRGRQGRARCRGVRQDGPIRDIPGMVRLLTFYDPDDNALMFYQDLSEAHG